MEELKSSLKNLIQVIVNVLFYFFISSLIIFVLGIIFIKTFQIPFEFTYIKSIGLMALLFCIRFAVRFFKEGFGELFYQ